MKKRILSIALVVAMLAIAVAGSTLAYLTDTEGAKNVMVAGNVNILQNENMKNGSAFVQNQKFVPAVYNGQLSYDSDFTFTVHEGEDYEGTVSYKIWEDSVDNEIDKIVTVTNNGTEAAYVRTIFLFEKDGDALIHYLAGISDGQELVLVDNEVVTIGTDEYLIYVSTYNTAVAPNATTDPSLVSIFLDPTATNQWYDDVEGSFDIYAFSQAVQVAGFDSATEGLDAAFGAVTAANVQNWIGTLGI